MMASHSTSGEITDITHIMIHFCQCCVTFLLCRISYMIFCVFPFSFSHFIKRMSQNPPPNVTHVCPLLPKRPLFLAWSTTSQLFSFNSSALGSAQLCGVRLKPQWFEISFGAARTGEMFPRLSFSTAVGSDPAWHRQDRKPNATLMFSSASQLFLFPPSAARAVNAGPAECSALPPVPLSLNA